MLSRLPWHTVGAIAWLIAFENATLRLRTPTQGICTITNSLAGAIWALPLPYAVNPGQGNLQRKIGLTYSALRVFPPCSSSFLYMRRKDGCSQKSMSYGGEASHKEMFHRRLWWIQRGHEISRRKGKLDPSCGMFPLREARNIIPETIFYIVSISWCLVLCAHFRRISRRARNAYAQMNSWVFLSDMKDLVYNGKALGAYDAFSNFLELHSIKAVVAIPSSSCRFPVMSRGWS